VLGGSGPPRRGASCSLRWGGVWVLAQGRAGCGGAQVHPGASTSTMTSLMQSVTSPKCNLLQVALWRMQKLARARQSPLGHPPSRPCPALQLRHLDCQRLRALGLRLGCCLQHSKQVRAGGRQRGEHVMRVLERAAMRIFFPGQSPLSPPSWLPTPILGHS